jgi:hypothetical protein
MIVILKKYTRNFYSSCFCYLTFFFAPAIVLHPALVTLFAIAVASFLSLPFLTASSMYLFFAAVTSAAVFLTFQAAFFVLTKI